MNKNSLFLRIYYILSMKRCQNSIICFFCVHICSQIDPIWLQMTTSKKLILNFPLSRRRSKKGARNSLFYLFIDARRKNKSGSKRALGDDDGMDEKRHEGCDGRDHDAPFTNKTHACFVSTCYITRITATRVWTSMCAYTTATRWRRLQRAPEARSSFLFRSSLRRSVVYEKTN